MKHKLITISLCLITIAAVVAGILIPHIMLSYEVKRELSIVHSAPEEYYLASDTVMAKQASEQLSVLDRLKFISGSWDSTYIACETAEGTLSELEAASLGKEQLNHLYTLGVYPYSLGSTYDNWYSWQAVLYKYTDNVFNTYTVYLWCITYSKYDGSLSHKIYITENGTIVLAETAKSNNRILSVLNAFSDDELAITMRDPSLSVTKKEASSTDKPQVEYPDLNLDDASFFNVYDITLDSANNSGDYVIFQYETENTYGLGISSE